VLTYNICVHARNTPRIRYVESGDPQVQRLRKALEQWANAAKDSTKPRVLVYSLKNHYSEENLRFQALGGNDQHRGTILRTIVEDLGINLFTGTHERYIVSEGRNDSNFTEQPKSSIIVLEKHDLRTLRKMEEEIVDGWYSPFYPEYVDYPKFPTNFEISCREIIQSDLFSRAPNTMGDSGFLGEETSVAEYW
jgi:hypothetical protein